MSRSIKLKFSIFTLSLVATLNTHADATVNLKPYVGIDVGQQISGFKKGYGEEVFAKKSPFVDAYIGKMFNDYFGIEGGMSISKKKNRTARIEAGGALPGVAAVEPGYHDITESEVQNRNYYLGLIGMYPFNNKFSIFGFVGLAQTWLKAHYKPLVLANIGSSLSEQAMTTRTFKSHGNNLVLKIGAKYNLTDNFGIKGVIAWENTNKFKTKSSQSPAANDFVKHTNTTKVGIGFYLHV